MGLISYRTVFVPNQNLFPPSFLAIHQNRGQILAQLDEIRWPATGREGLHTDGAILICTRGPGRSVQERTPGTLGQGATYRYGAFFSKTGVSTLVTTERGGFY